jgi:hypothetical protein
MKALVCSNSLCSNEAPMTDDPLKEWCNECYPKRVEREERNHRGLKMQTAFVNQHWRVPKRRSA